MQYSSVYRAFTICYLLHHIHHILTAFPLAHNSKNDQEISGKCVTRLNQGLLYWWGSARSPAALSPQQPQKFLRSKSEFFVFPKISRNYNARSKQGVAVQVGVGREPGHPEPAAPPLMSWLLSDDLTRWEQGLLYRWGSGKPGHPEPAAAPGFAIKMKVSSLNIIRKQNGD